MNLVIDIGNTRTKIFVFEGDQLVTDYSFHKLSATNLLKLLSRHKIKASILSTVVKRNVSAETLLKKQGAFISLDYKTELPLKNRYKTRETLGNDRIANACGAMKIFPSKNILVIDAGTCVKYDVINSRKEYLGGAISPGLTMRYRSLHEYTAMLPLIQPAEKVTLIGGSTRESLVSGVQQGMLNEMEGYIRLMKKKYNALKVILTGGDAPRFAHLLNFPIFAAPKLTATGLNEILQYHQKKK